MRKSHVFCASSDNMALGSALSGQHPVNIIAQIRKIPELSGHITGKFAGQFLYPRNRFIPPGFHATGPVERVPILSLRTKRSNLIFFQVIVIEIASSADLSVCLPRNDISRVFRCATVHRIFLINMGRIGNGNGGSLSAPKSEGRIFDG